jgi:hypothetical protein
MKKGKDKKKKTKNLRTSKQTASRHLQAAEIPVAEMDEIAEWDMYRAAAGLPPTLAHFKGSTSTVNTNIPIV